MPDPKQITELPVASSAADADLMLLRQSASDKQVSVLNVLAPCLRAANDLDDVADVPTARTNLGVAATTDTLLKADNLSGLANAATSRTNLGLGNLAVEDASDLPTLRPHGVTIYDTAGAHEFTVPALVTQIEVYLSSGGSGGGEGGDATTDGDNGADGGASTVQRDATVILGADVSTFAGGRGGDSDSNGGDNGNPGLPLGLFNVGAGWVATGGKAEVGPYISPTSAVIGGVAPILQTRGGDGGAGTAGGGAGGGGNVCWIYAVLAVTPGEDLDITLGAGGAGGNGSSTGTAGSAGTAGKCIIRY